MCPSYYTNLRTLVWDTEHNRACTLLCSTNKQQIWALLSVALGRGRHLICPSSYKSVRSWWLTLTHLIHFSVIFCILPFPLRHVNDDPLVKEMRYGRGPVDNHFNIIPIFAWLRAALLGHLVKEWPEFVRRTTRTSRPWWLTVTHLNHIRHLPYFSVPIVSCQGQSIVGRIWDPAGGLSRIISISSLSLLGDFKSLMETRGSAAIAKWTHNHPNSCRDLGLSRNPLRPFGKRPVWICPLYYTNLKTLMAHSNQSEPSSLHLLHFSVPIASCQVQYIGGRKWDAAGGLRESFLLI